MINRLGVRIKQPVILDSKWNRLFQFAFLSNPGHRLARSISYNNGILISLEDQFNVFCRHRIDSNTIGQ